MDLDHWKTARTEEPPSYKFDLANNLYFGTPDQCANLRDRHGIGYFGAAFSFGSIEHSKVMALMKLFAQEVMPKFQ